MSLPWCLLLRVWGTAWAIDTVLSCHLTKHWFTPVNSTDSAPAAFTELTPYPGKFSQPLKPHTSMRSQVSRWVRPAWPITWTMKSAVCICIFFMSWPFQQTFQSLQCSCLWNRKGCHFPCAFSSLWEQSSNCATSCGLFGVFPLIVVALWLVLRAPWLEMNLTDTWN